MNCIKCNDCRVSNNYIVPLCNFHIKDQKITIEREGLISIAQNIREMCGLPSSAGYMKRLENIDYIPTKTELKGLKHDLETLV